MTKPIVPKKDPFSKVKEARQALADKTLELFEQYQALIRDAIAAQEFEVAAQGLEFLMKHIPKDADGVTFLDPAIDKTVNTGGGGSKTPTIQIGIALGGGPQHKALPEAEIIDVEGEVS